MKIVSFLSVLALSLTGHLSQAARLKCSVRIDQPPPAEEPFRETIEKEATDGMLEFTYFQKEFYVITSNNVFQQIGIKDSVTKVRAFNSNGSTHPKFPEFLNISEVSLEQDGVYTHLSCFIIKDKEAKK